MLSSIAPTSPIRALRGWSLSVSSETSSYSCSLGTALRFTVFLLIGFGANLEPDLNAGEQSNAIRGQVAQLERLGDVVGTAKPQRQTDV